MLAWFHDVYSYVLSVDSSNVQHCVHIDNCQMNDRKNDVFSGLFSCTNFAVHTCKFFYRAKIIFFASRILLCQRQINDF